MAFENLTKLKGYFIYFYYIIILYPRQLEKNNNKLFPSIKLHTTSAIYHQKLSYKYPRSATRCHCTSTSRYLNAINIRATPPTGPRQRPRRAMADATTRRHFDGDNGAYLATAQAATPANTVRSVKRKSRLIHAMNTTLCPFYELLENGERIDAFLAKANLRLVFFAVFASF